METRKEICMGYKVTNQKVIRTLRLLYKYCGSKRQEELVEMYNKQSPPWLRLVIPRVSAGEMARILSFLIAQKYVEVEKQYATEKDEDPPQLYAYYTLSQLGLDYMGKVMRKT